MIDRYNNVQTADEVAIRALIERWSIGVTCRDPVEIRAVLAEDATWRVETPYNVSFEGSLPIASNIVESLSSFQFLIQQVHATVIHIDGNKAKARSLMSESGRARDGHSGMVMQGIYDDELTLGDAGWRFKQRIFTPILVSTVPQAGDVYELPPAWSSSF